MLAAPFVIALLGTIAGIFACKGLGKRETRYALWSLALHVASSIVQWVVTELYYGVSDAHGYLDDGVQIARLLDYNFLNYAPEVAKYALHLESQLPDASDVSGSGTMKAIAGFFVFIIGPSVLSNCLLTTFIAWFGQLCLYRSVRDEVSEDGQTPVLIGCLLVPSVVFWGSGFAKEAFVMGAFGVLTLSTYRVLRNWRPVYLIGMAASGLTIAMIKPYVLFSYVIAVAAWVYAAGALSGTHGSRLRPAYLLLAGALAVGGLAEMGTLFPEYAADKIADSMATQQETWQENQGGSYTELGSGEARSVGQQLRYVPKAVINALFRPAIFEARNATQVGAAIETTLFAMGVLSLFGKHARSVAGQVIRSSPLLIFCIAFVGSFAVCVGLASSNLGSLSRYRVPMMPFYAIVLLTIRQQALMQKATAAEKHRLALALLRRSRSV
jgi:hypothetical protein